ncbi:MAG: hypothetical protein ACO3EK_03970 [Alphaproteobacteria bacterium]|jgi:hypothetical protein
MKRVDAALARLEKAVAGERRGAAARIAEDVDGVLERVESALAKARRAQSGLDR